MKIAVIGTGYVGLVTGTCLAEIGHTVCCVDVSAEKIKKLQDGISPIYEPGLDPLIQQNIEHNRLSFTTDLEKALDAAQIAFIAVGTPEGSDGSADLTYVRQVAQDIVAKAQGSILVVVKSTVPVGTCDEVEAILQKGVQQRNLPYKLTVASNPEFLKEGAAISDFMRPDRIVVGVTNPQDEALLRELYTVFVIDDPGKILVVDRRSSELIKYGSNAMLATRISFMNELSRLCEAMGADIDCVRRGMGSDGRIGRKFLWAGPGYGGSCFPKDVQALLRTGRQKDVTLSVLHAVEEANEKQKQYSGEKVLRYYRKLMFQSSLSIPRVTVWGLAFKPGTDDVRESPAQTIISMILAEGIEVVAHDPHGAPNFAKEFGPKKGLSYATNAYEALKQSDGLVLVTEWSEYKRPNWGKVASLMRHRAVFDLRNQYSYSQVKQAGFYYESMGRPDDSAHNRTKI